MLTTIWNTVLYYPILNLLIVFYHLLGDNLGFAIMLIAIIARLLLMPLTKRQTEMTKKMGSLKPELDKLQKKYANNQEALAQEQMKLYKKVGYNPLGCLGTFIPQLVILSVLIAVIRAVTDNHFEGMYTFVQNWVSPDTAFVLDPNFFIWDLTKSYNGISSEFGRLSIQALPYIGLAGLVGIAQFFASKFTQMMQNPNKKSKKKTSKKGSDPNMEDMQQKMMGSMNYMLPFMTMFISISAPSALSLYWFIQSLMLIVQYVLLDWDKTKKGVQNLRTVIKERRNSPIKEASK